MVLKILNFEIEADASASSVDTLRSRKTADISFARVTQTPADSSNTFMQAKTRNQSGLTFRQIRDVASLFQIVDESSVNAFLSKNPIEALLDEAHEYLTYYFPNNTFVLRLNFDPDGPQLHHLCLEIEIDRANIEYELAQLTKFRNHWWLKSLYRVNGSLTVSLAV